MISWLTHPLSVHKLFEWFFLWWMYICRYVCIHTFYDASFLFYAVFISLPALNTSYSLRCCPCFCFFYKFYPLVSRATCPFAYSACLIWHPIENFLKICSELIILVLMLLGSHPRFPFPLLLSSEGNSRPNCPLNDCSIILTDLLFINSLCIAVWVKTLDKI